VTGTIRIGINDITGIIIDITEDVS